MWFAFAFLAIMPFFILLNSCTIIGASIGSSLGKKQDAKRPVIMPELNAINELAVGTRVVLFRNDGKKIQGRYVETNTDSLPVIKLKMPGKSANQMIVLNDIDHIVVGYKADGPKFAGIFLGLMVDGIVWTIIAVAINNAISP